MSVSARNLDPEIVAELVKFQEWVEAQLKAEGAPSAGFRYMRLTDAISAILDGRHYCLDEADCWNRAGRASESP